MSDRDMAVVARSIHDLYERLRRLEGEADDQALLYEADVLAAAAEKLFDAYDILVDGDVESRMTDSDGGAAEPFGRAS